MGHTPGPWAIRQAVSKLEKDFVIMADGGIIAEVFERGGHKYEIVSESEANAQLIAVSPDLLGACKDAREAIEAAVVQLNGRGIACPAVLGLVSEDIRRVIKKAEPKELESCKEQWSPA